jgi:DNA-binding transcriptional MerR regulator
MTMTFNQAGDAVPVNDDGVSGVHEDYTRIGEMAKMFGVTLRTLRFYEDKGLLSPKRDGSTRLYTRRDRARLKLILLGRKVGFSLRDVKQIMDLYDPKGANTKQLRLMLDKSDKQLGRLQKQRTALDEAITELSGLMGTVRNMLAERTQPTAVWKPAGQSWSAGFLHSWQNSSAKILTFA